MISCTPEAIFVGSYSIWHAACSDPDNGSNLHSVEGLKVPPESESNLTIPVGVDGVASVSVSVTMAVHVAGCETTTSEPQLTETVVTCSAASACEDPNSIQHTATTPAARRARRHPSQRRRRSPSRKTHPPNMMAIVNPGLTRLSPAAPCDHGRRPKRSTLEVGFLKEVTDGEVGWAQGAGGNRG